MSGRRERPRAARYPSPGTRLRRRSDFQRCYERGRRRHGARLSLYALENGREVPRFGITVTRKVGGAVVRNRIKRRLREIYRQWHGSTPIGPLDVVLHVRPSAARASFGELEQELQTLLRKLSVR